MSRDAVRIRLGRPEDARAIGVLGRRVVRRWVLPDQPRRVSRVLLPLLSAKMFRNKMLEGQRFFLAYLGKVLVGVAAMRDDRYLAHFYVSTRHQRQGIARRLWQRAFRDARRRAGTCCFTLHATRCAVPVYLRFGFRMDGPEQPSPSGVLTTPMSLSLPARSGRGA